MPTISVTGMGCAGCGEIVENALGEVSGVESVEADHESGVVEYDGEAGTEAVRNAVEFAGYAVADED
jgi:copper chaperone CopZ